MIYGRLTPAEVAERGDNPFIEANGRVYRITERHKTMLGVVNYQAEECDPREYTYWKDLREEARRAAEELAGAVQQVAERKEDDEGAAGVREPRHPPPDEPPDLAAAASRPYDPEQGWYKDVPIPPIMVPPAPASIPPLAFWAKQQGWRGRGRMPAALKERYYREVNPTHDREPPE